MKYIYLYLILAIQAAANTIAHGVMQSPPPKGKQIVAFANNMNDWTRRVNLRRDQLIAFLDKGTFYPTLPTDLEKQLHWHDVMILCDGVFTDKKAKVFFWTMAAPEFLSIGNEEGKNCLIYLSPSPLDQDQIHALSVSENSPNKALEPTSTAVTPPAIAGDRASGARGSP